MRTMMSGAAAFTAAIALSLLSSAAHAAQPGAVCVRAPSPQALPVSGEMFEQIEGKYQLSNGERVTLQRVGARLWVAFGTRRGVPLDRVGETQFAARDGSVRLSYQPELEEISMRYLADESGRYVRAC